jgi:hypothetical protein
MPKVSTEYIESEYMARFAQMPPESRAAVIKGLQTMHLIALGRERVVKQSLTTEPEPVQQTLDGQEG